MGQTIHTIEHHELPITVVNTIVSHARPGFYKRLCIETDITLDGPVSYYLVSTKTKDVILRTKDIDKAIYCYNNCD